MTNVYNIPPTYSFVDALAHHLLTQTSSAPETLSSYTILLPNRRGIKALRDSFLRQSGGQPLLLPIIRPLADISQDELTLAGFAPNLPTPISTLRRQIILSRYLTATFPDGYTTAQSLTTANELSRFLDSLHTEGLTLDQLDTLIAGEYAEHWNISLSFLTQVLREYWPQQLLAEQALDPAEHRRRLMQAYTQFLNETPPTTPIIAAGSTGSIPATAHLLKTIANLPNGQVILPGLDTHLPPDAWDQITEGHPQAVMKNLLTTFGIKRDNVKPLPNLPTSNAQTPEQKSAREKLISEIMRPAATVTAWTTSPQIIPPATHNLHLLEAETLDQEATAIALMMREHAQNSGDETMLLITPDRLLANRVTLMLRRWNITIDDSAGTPLSQTPVGTFFLLLTQTLAENLAPIPLLGTLKHNLCAGGGNIENWRNFVRKLEHKALRGVRPANLTARAPENLAPDAAQIQTLFDNALSTTDDKIQTLITLAQTLATTPEILGDNRLWAGEAGEGAANYFSNLLEQSDIIPALSWADLHALLLTTMGSVTIRPRYGTHPRLAILGAMEARLYQADTMILASLNENTWPPIASVDGWLSRPMRADYGLPSPERAITLSAHDFCQGLGASTVYLTRSKLRDGAPTTPSRWLQRLDAALKAADIPPITGHTPYLNWATRLDMPTAPLKNAIQPVANPPIDARPMRLSVTDIANLYKDPYGIYAKYTLNLRPWDDLDAEPGPAERGQLIHSVLEKFSKTYPALWPDNAYEKLIATGQEIFNRAGDHPDIIGHWWPRFERMAKNYVEFEATWRHNTKEIFTEKTGELPLNINGHTITLRGRADRIESHLGTGYSIIDYKSGAAPSKKSVTEGKEPQLTLLAAMLQSGAFNHALNLKTAPQDLTTLSYWPISGSKDDFIPSTIDKDLDELSANAYEKLTAILSEYMQGKPYISWPDASQNRPSYYPYTHFERIAEWQDETDDEDTAA